jgi:protein O-GlcNAc transferase
MISDQVFRTAQQLHQAGRLREAEAEFARLHQTDPKDPRVIFMLGAIAHQTGRLDESLRWLDQAIAIDARFTEAWFLKGLIHQQQGQLEPAIAAYRRVVMLQPNHGKGLNNLGRALLDSGKTTEALTTLRQAAAASPNNPGAQSNLGDALRVAGDLPGAIAQYRKSISIQPNFAEGHSNLGCALGEQHKLNEGITSLQRAIAINPRSGAAHYNLAKLLWGQSRIDDAIHHCQLAIELRPAFADAYNIMGNLIGIGGRMTEAIAYQRKAVELKPDHHDAHSNLLLSLHYLDDPDPHAIFEAHLNWAKQHAPHAGAGGTPTARMREGNRKIRIGYVSPNFQNHSVAYFFEPVLNAHDRSSFEIFCYADVEKSDAATKRIQSRCDVWRDITDQPDSVVSRQIQQDGIDILIDLAGHTAHNRMMLFALKPAPVQITWLGYPDTTGLATMDYRITDAIADPPGESDRLHTEQLIRIDGGCWAYAPPTDAPLPGPPPALANGFITFGSFNNLPKVTPRVLETWARILHRVPRSRLVLKALGLSSSAGRHYILDHLTQSAIDPARIELLAWAPDTASHLSLYNRIDIALDTFPYNGTTTTCETLWMGVPLITFPGQTHAGRVGASLLTHIGCTEFLAADLTGYIARAVELSADFSTLAKSRAQLRDRLANSPVCNADRLTRQLENVFKATA